MSSRKDSGLSLIAGIERILIAISKKLCIWRLYIKLYTKLYTKLCVQRLCRRLCTKLYTKPYTKLYV